MMCLPASVGMARPSSGGATYTTLNPLDKSSQVVLSGGNLIASTLGASNSGIVRAVSGKSAGKWYFEAVVAQVASSGVDECSVGLARVLHAVNTALGYTDTDGWAMWGWGGSGYRNGAPTFPSSAMTNGAVIGFHVDLDNDCLWVSVNGSQLQGDPETNTSPLSSNLTGIIYPAACPWKNNTITMRFDPGTWSYTPAPGYGPWTT